MLSACGAIWFHWRLREEAAHVLIFKVYITVCFLKRFSSDGGVGRQVVADCYFAFRTEHASSPRVQRYVIVFWR